MTAKEKGLVLGVLTGTIYGLVLRLLAQSPYLGVMSFAFLIVGPYMIGWLSVHLAYFPGMSRKAAFFWPFAAIALGSFATFLFFIEGLICIVMYLPLGLVLAGMGGLMGREIRARSKARQLYAVLFLPFATQWVENRIQIADDFHVVTNSVVIQGPASAVWSEIKSVKTIAPAELSSSWIYAMGFPRPLDAEIDHERVGGVRRARFERGLVFNETVDQWVPNRALSFRIDIDPKDVPPSALDEHVTIGGPFFDVLRGTYRIESQPDGSVTLLLESRFRLSTHFNFYAAFWTDRVMHQIQSNILQVIRARVERHPST